MRGDWLRGRVKQGPPEANHNLVPRFQVLSSRVDTRRDRVRLQPWEHQDQGPALHHIGRAACACDRSGACAALMSFAPF
jgi:hypothetical protein